MPSSWAIKMMALHSARSVQPGARLRTKLWSILMKSMSKRCRYDSDE